MFDLVTQDLRHECPISELAVVNSGQLPEIKDSRDCLADYGCVVGVTRRLYCAINIV